jgi:hypothetical protein
LWSNAPVLSNTSSTLMSPKSISFCHPTSSETEDSATYEKSLAQTQRV